MITERLLREGGYENLANEYIKERRPVLEYANPEIKQGAIVYAQDYMDNYYNLEPDIYNAGIYLLDLTEEPGKVVLTPLKRGSLPIEPIEIGDFMEHGFSNGHALVVSHLPDTNTDTMNSLRRRIG